MDPTKSVELILSWQTLLLGVVLYGLTSLERRGLEAMVPSVKEKKWWTEFLLPASPLLLGALFSLAAVDFPYPAGLKTVSVRLIYGIGVGLASTWIYARVKGLIKPKDDTTPDVTTSSPLMTMKPADVPAAAVTPPVPPKVS